MVVMRLTAKFEQGRAAGTRQKVTYDNCPACDAPLEFHHHTAR